MFGPEFGKAIVGGLILAAAAIAIAIAIAIVSLIVGGLIGWWLA